MTARLLVVHTGGVGDFICTFPTLSALAQSYMIDLAGIPERVNLARAAGLTQAVHDLERTGFSSVFSDPDARLREFVRPFDEALVWMADDDGLIARNLQRAGLPSVRCFPGIPPQDWGGHAAHWYGSCAGMSISLPCTASFPRTPSGPDVVIQPGSGSRNKNWPLDHFDAVGAWLKAQGLQVHWCVGPAEENLPPRSPMLPAMPLVDLAGLLAGAKLFVGNDSGISHLAALSGCPTLALFGPTDPGVWAPAGPRVRVLQGQPWPSPEQACAAARALVEGS